MENRHGKIMREVQNECKENLHNFETVAEKFKLSYDNVMGKLDNIIRKNCNQFITWLEANSEFTQEGPVPKDKSKTEEFNNNVKEIELCIKQHDLGVNESLLGFENKVRLVDAALNDNIRNCLKDNDDIEAKKCAKTHFQNGIIQMASLYEEQFMKIDEISKRI